jgi:hypothetical protein
MEFIVTGLFIIFFSYILLYSLYVRFFKSSDNIVEGLSAEEKGTAGLNKANSANGKIATHNAKHEQMTLVNGMDIVKKPSNP